MTSDGAAGPARSYVVSAGRNKEQVLDNFAQALEFPDYFGHNYDALADCLGDFAAGLHAPTTLTWQVSEQFAQQPGFSVICEILRQSEAAAPRDSAAAPLLTVHIRRT